MIEFLSKIFSKVRGWFFRKKPKLSIEDRKQENPYLLDIYDAVPVERSQRDQTIIDFLDFLQDYIRKMGFSLIVVRRGGISQLNSMIVKTYFIHGSIEGSDIYMVRSMFLKSDDTNFEVFDPTNDKHLYVIIDRSKNFDPVLKNKNINYLSDNFFAGLNNAFIEIFSTSSVNIRTVEPHFAKIEKDLLVERHKIISNGITKPVHIHGNTKIPTFLNPFTKYSKASVKQF